MAKIAVLLIVLGALICPSAATSGLDVSTYVNIDEFNCLKQTSTLHLSDCESLPQCRDT